MTIPQKPLALVKEMVEQLGQDVTYAYEDLVFVSHDHYLLRFTEQNDELALHINTECSPDQAEKLAEAVTVAGAAKGLNVTRQADYTLTANEADETLSLAFEPS